MITWPQRLTTDLSMERVVLFIGSGVSRNSLGKDGKTRPKTWHLFLEEAAKQRGIIDKIKPYLEARDYLTALDVLRYGMRQEDYAALLRQEYQEPAYEPAAIHDAIYRLNCKIVLTPNFDKIYDVFVGGKSRGTIDVKEYHCPEIAEFIRGDRQVVIKVHGSVDAHKQMIFGRKDYAKARVEHSHFYDVLKALILTHTFLFIGCGIDDPDIRLVLEDLNFGSVGSRGHYFIAAKDTINQDMKNVLADTMNLKIIEYDFDPKIQDHSALTTSIQELATSLGL
ncbi:SIR2 family protein [Janthinobacterium sp. SUN176]|uniref:SIR2 family protein n=1 Tax=Janthinobacterium sp. SUN176 TaxID=3014788 RepID=UPI002713DBB5|nr:SIR2 family protein [Janthinobacterium sp. SUN176]MDO8071079.1 SIR2 family protein [Janthinobacterium sp. SUN176]